MLHDGLGMERDGLVMLRDGRAMERDGLVVPRDGLGMECSGLGMERDGPGKLRPGQGMQRPRGTRPARIRSLGGTLPMNEQRRRAVAPSSRSRWRGAFIIGIDGRPEAVQGRGGGFWHGQVSGTHSPRVSVMGKDQLLRFAPTMRMP